MNVNSAPLLVQGMSAPAQSMETVGIAQLETESGFNQILSDMLLENPVNVLPLFSVGESEPITYLPFEVTDEKKDEENLLLSVMVQPSVTHVPPVDTQVFESSQDPVVNVQAQPVMQTQLLTQTAPLVQTSSPVLQEAPVVTAPESTQQIPQNTFQTVFMSQPDSSSTAPETRVLNAALSQTNDTMQPAVVIQQEPTEQKEPVIRDTLTKTAVSETLVKTQERTQQELKTILEGKDIEAETGNHAADQARQESKAVAPQQQQPVPMQRTYEQVSLKTAETQKPVSPEQAVRLITAKIQHLRSGETELTLRLQPEELGEISIKLVTKDGKVEIEIQTETVKAQELLSAKGDQIAQSLKETPLRLERYQVVQSNPPSQETQQQYTLDADARGQQQNRQSQNPEKKQQEADVEYDFESLLMSVGTL